jgi:alkyl hydroperoxide reductase subunit AhpF
MAFGGQVLETLGIENVIGTPYVEGPQLMRQVEEHVKQYDVEDLTAEGIHDHSGLDSFTSSINC